MKFLLALAALLALALAAQAHGTSSRFSVSYASAYAQPFGCASYAVATQPFGCSGFAVRTVRLAPVREFHATVRTTSYSSVSFLEGHGVASRARRGPLRRLLRRGH